MGTKVEKICLGIVYGEKQKNLFLLMTEFLKKEWSGKQIEFACFSLADINFNTMTVLATIITSDNIVLETREIPVMIYNLVYHTKLESIKAMRKLRTCENIVVINPTNRFNQSVLFEILEAFPESEQFLLPFEYFGESTFVEYIEKYDRLFLFPERGIAPKNTVYMEQLDSEKFKIYTGIHELTCLKKELYSILLKMTLGKKYMILKGLNILLWHERPFEVRVYLQKNSIGGWEVVDSVAKAETFSFGSAYAGTTEDFAKILCTLLPDNAGEVFKKIYQLATILCSYLEYYVMNMGTFFIDFILDCNGTAFVIYIGGVEQKFCSEKLKTIYYHNMFQYMVSFYRKNASESDGGGSNGMDENKIT